MSRESEKKEFERRTVEAWQRVEEAAPPGPLVEGESPDFLVHTPGGTVGIEVTQLLIPDSGPKAKARERYQKRVVERARDQHASSRGLACDILVLFGLGTPVTRSSVGRIADALVEIVRRESSEDTNWTWRNDTLTVPEISQVRGGKAHTTSAPNWQVWHTGQIPQAERCWIQSAIDRKSLLTYSITMDQIWLLLVSEGYRSSSIALFGEPVLKQLYTAPFARVFLFDVMRKNSVDLRIQRG